VVPKGKGVFAVANINLMHTAVVLIHESGDAVLVPNPTPRGRALPAEQYKKYMANKNIVGKTLRDRLRKLLPEVDASAPASLKLLSLEIDVARAGTPFATVLYACCEAQRGHEEISLAFEKLPPTKGITFEVLPAGSLPPKDVVRTDFAIYRFVSGASEVGGPTGLMERIFNLDAMKAGSNTSFDDNASDSAVVSILHEPGAELLSDAVPRTGPTTIRAGNVNVLIRNTVTWGPCPSCKSSLHSRSNCPLQPVAKQQPVEPPKQAEPAAPQPAPVEHSCRPSLSAQVPVPSQAAMYEKIRAHVAASARQAASKHAVPARTSPQAAPLGDQHPIAVGPMTHPEMMPVSSKAPYPRSMLAYLSSARTGRGGSARATGATNRPTPLSKLLDFAAQLPAGVTLRDAIFPEAFMKPSLLAMREFLAFAIRDLPDPDLKLYNTTENFMKIVMDIRGELYTPPTCPDGFTAVENSKKDTKKRTVSDSTPHAESAAAVASAAAAAASDEEAGGTPLLPPAKRQARGHASEAGGAAATSDTEGDDMTDAAGAPLEGRYDDYDAN
jgi:hypothetical protein